MSPLITGLVHVLLFDVVVLAMLVIFYETGGASIGEEI